MAAWHGTFHRLHQRVKAAGSSALSPASTTLPGLAEEQLSVCVAVSGSDDESFEEIGSHGGVGEGLRDDGHGRKDLMAPFFFLRPSYHCIRAQYRWHSWVPLSPGGGT